MTMIEKVGRALAKEEGYAYDPHPYDVRARAAIEAMREPTEKVLKSTSVGFPHNVWAEMIDAALSEKP